ncbi:hypothetical protein SDC9_118329 [bioreactor metagenome]|uniref:Uncharacterized protein n=1 Tax=bioreactor metagenome TaxID=1076179 RepID=A0A645C1F4_9ZZZZ
MDRLVRAEQGTLRHGPDGVEHRHRHDHRVLVQRHRDPDGVPCADAGGDAAQCGPRCPAQQLRGRRARAQPDSDHPGAAREAAECGDTAHRGPLLGAHRKEIQVQGRGVDPVGQTVDGALVR